jgi:hypothetical protein
MAIFGDPGRHNGIYGGNAQEALSAAPLKLTLSTDNLFKGLYLRPKADSRYTTTRA